ncbi:hypothetical protein QL285_002551 [Trifolium repens]|jgi:hypothetical protein|nr:hypothetical protein QL285_002551 [Trifolium repens]
MASSSSTSVSSNVINLAYRKTLIIKPRTMTIRENELKLIIEQMVDFKSLRANVHDLKEFFEVQGWIPCFEMLNGLFYEGEKNARRMVELCFLFLSFFKMTKA